MGLSEKNAKVLENIARPGNRSPLFWWMLEHHDEIVELAAGRRMDWKSFVAVATALGITDTLGRPIKERNARETWRQVRLEKARLEVWWAENEAARAAKEAERAARRRMREATIVAEKAQPPGAPRQWPAPIVARERQAQDAGRRESKDVGAPARVVERETISRAEYTRRRNERGPDGLLTDEAMRLRDRESRDAKRRHDDWMLLKYKDEEDEGPSVEG